MASKFGGCPTLNSVQKSGNDINIPSEFYSLIRGVLSTGKIPINLKVEASNSGTLLLKRADETQGIELYGSNYRSMITYGLVIGGTSLNSSAKLELVSTTQGFLPPRMTTAQKNAISSPAEGLIVYDLTEHKPYVYNGTSWESLL